MIVVMIIAILISVAVPQFILARHRSWQRTCLSNLRQIGNAKEVWAMEMRATAGDPVVAADIVPDFIRGSALPICPGGGNYTLQPVGDTPTCDRVDPQFPHVAL